jgi:hypothetical protein
MTTVHPPLQPSAPPWAWIARLWRRLWAVHPPLELVVALRPADILATLKTAAKPSTERLHLRELFASGRRYQMTLDRNADLLMQTTSKVGWHPRRRTTASATLCAHLEGLEDGRTRLTLSSRMRVLVGLESLVAPAFMTSLLIYMPWDGLLLALLVAALFSLSWLGLRANAALEAQEMLFFVHKALEDQRPREPLALHESGHIVYDYAREFQTAWDKFYDELHAP